MLEISTGRSQKDRITFYLENSSATAIRNENGTISIDTPKKNFL